MFVDTNVLVIARALNTPDRQLALDVLACTRRTEPLRISRQVVREYLAVVTCPQAWGAPLPMSEALHRLCPVFGVVRDAGRRADGHGHARYAVWRGAGQRQTGTRRQHRGDHGASAPSVGGGGIKVKWRGVGNRARLISFFPGSFFREKRDDSRRFRWRFDPDPTPDRLDSEAVRRPHTRFAGVVLVAAERGRSAGGIGGESWLGGEDVPPSWRRIGALISCPMGR